MKTKHRGEWYGSGFAASRAPVGKPLRVDGLLWEKARDGRNDEGTRVAANVYVVRIRAGTDSRVALVAVGGPR